MLHRLLRPDEDWQFGLRAINPNSTKSVFDHVSSGSSPGWQSQFISTCGNLNAVITFNKNILNPTIVKIWENNLPTEKIDLRTPENRRNYYTDCPDLYKSNLKFDNYAKKFEEMLLVRYVPATHVELWTSTSDFPSTPLLQ